MTLSIDMLQFSMIDSRPTVRMGTVCEAHDVKLLTYGTLVSPNNRSFVLGTNWKRQCGGFIAEKWLDKPEPDLFSDGITPSQRKVRLYLKGQYPMHPPANILQYFDMIRLWGGWTLFQELLQTLQVIASKYKVSVSNVATRWVLDFPYVGAVIVGARMGVSEHAEDNLRCYGWRLDDDDNQAIDSVLERSRRHAIYNELGDCGGEYRL